ncbi:carbamoyltransferase HypF [Anaeromyxobacter oryzae]|uniref:Carbamoyltransferase n=1 Tax=Anaeromyxobacter oryzae TaxID=2918170 RepID=A0ABM7WPJ5_9BACT|nr:carbamoyltransferase HypF [Anaeromyxobacter oryzae]BDG01379.1 carbamoyltransferase [Anaeromyxobacter oryzae]
MRRGIRVRGAVQGVGFRPTVFRLARDAGLAGLVRNDDDGVWIEVEGAPEALEAFPGLLRARAPPLCRIDAVEVAPLAPLGEAGFRVAASATGLAARAAIPSDAATCDECLRELGDPGDRRHRYPFVNCTDCGPRYTIVRDVPYDRARTTMDRFALCPACRAEYEDPGSRRFHAEPNACPACGPRLELRAPGRPAATGDAAVSAAVAVLRGGGVVAVKGLGGYLLATDARDEAAVARLRVAKRRPHRPFAIMARDLAEARAVAEVDEAGAALLASRARPIVLLPARLGAGVAPSVAPGLPELGLMLPPTPLHHLLLADGPRLLVMTSGNVSEEPIARSDAEALERLAPLADAVLLHDREIHARADDSVVRVVDGRPLILRRARGFVPEPVPLLDAAPPLLAVGAELKATVCLARGGEAVLSPHLGDLSNVETHRFFAEVIERLPRLLGVRPEAVAHDLHPDYASTRWALASGLPRVPVQHHHAHVAACLAEHGRGGPVLGIAFDGTGCGPAGDLWGGEVLAVDLRGFRRLAWLRPIALAGGEAAIRAPWRLACAALLDAGEPLDLLARIPPPRLAAVCDLLARGVASPRATGAGRWFDAVAALCAVRDEISYEGQAAVELEGVAAPGEAAPYPFALAPGRAGTEVDLRPMVRALAAELRGGAGAASASARFHETLARAVGAACGRAREETRLGTVALSGGCFQNRRLSERCAALLAGAGFEVLRHGKVPPNDGGIALGQAAIAAHRLARGGGAAHVPRDPR